MFTFTQQNSTPHLVITTMYFIWALTYQISVSYSLGPHVTWSNKCKNVDGWVEMRKILLPNRHTKQGMTLYVTGFWKVDQNVTLSLFHLKLAQLMAMLIHYPFTVALPGLAD